MYHKAPDNSIHYVEPKFARLVLPEGSVQISEQEAHEILDSQKPKLSYIEQRQAAYPAITEFLDAYVKDDKKALKAYKDACLAVKEKYPKE